jgi:hypothetical protein
MIGNRGLSTNSTWNLIWVSGSRHSSNPDLSSCVDRYHTFFIKTRVCFGKTFLFSMFIGKKNSLTNRGVVWWIYHTTIAAQTYSEYRCVCYVQLNCTHCQQLGLLIGYPPRLPSNHVTWIPTSEETIANTELHRPLYTTLCIQFHSYSTLLCSVARFSSWLLRH